MGDGEGATGTGEKWLILGDRGFVGSHVRQAARQAGIHVVGASRSPEAEVRCDLGDREQVDTLIAVLRPSHIINAAGPPSVGRSWEHPEETLHLHATTALHLLEAARRHVPGCHLTFLSSAEVYGSSEADMDEATPITPLTPYGAAKAAMEILCGQHARAWGTKVAVLRLFNQIGPGLAPGHAITDFATAIAEAEGRRDVTASVRVGNPDSFRDYTDVRDSAEAIVSVARQRIGGTYNLCSGREISTRQLIESLAESTALPVEVVRDPALARPSDPARKVGDPARLAATIGWRAKTPLAQTLADILSSARQSVAGA